MPAANLSTWARTRRANQSMNNLNLMFQNPGMLKGVMQKVNPFKSTSQVDTTFSACCSGNIAMVVMCQTMRASRLLRFSRRSPKLHPQSRWSRDGAPTPIRWVKDDGVLNVPRHNYKPAPTHYHHTHSWVRKPSDTSWHHCLKKPCSCRVQHRSVSSPLLLFPEDDSHIDLICLTLSD